MMTEAKDSELRKGNKLPPQPESSEPCSSSSSDSSSETDSSHTVERGAVSDANNNMTSDHDDDRKRPAIAAHSQDDPVNKKTLTRSAGARVEPAPRKTFLGVAGKMTRPAAAGSVPNRDNPPSDAKDATDESTKTAKSDDQLEPIPHDQFQPVEPVEFDKKLGTVLMSLSSREFAAVGSVGAAVAIPDDDISSISNNYNTAKTNLEVATKVACYKQQQLASDATSIGESATTESPSSKQLETKRPTNTTPTDVGPNNKLTSPAADLPHKPPGEQPQASDDTTKGVLTEPVPAKMPDEDEPNNDSIKSTATSANPVVTKLPLSASNPPCVQDRHQARNNSMGMNTSPSKKARYTRRKSSELDFSSDVGSCASGYAPDEECTLARANIMCLRATGVSRHSRNKGSKKAKTDDTPPTAGVPSYAMKWLENE